MSNFQPYNECEHTRTCKAFGRCTENGDCKRRGKTIDVPARPVDPKQLR